MGAANPYPSAQVPSSRNQSRDAFALLALRDDDEVGFSARVGSKNGPERVLYALNADGSLGKSCDTGAKDQRTSPRCPLPPQL
ncbi:unnamed protein product [Somion occarium]|uniref:Uncharacterized protein n=1 Tax=Somion occarium TaxID=3059160 RepID=A0ABP1D0A0_9APHY